MDNYKMDKYKYEWEKEGVKKPPSKQFLENAERKIRTTMIAALDSFEKKFGHLWGHGKEEITEEEEHWDAVWDEVRTEILDRGNLNIRLIRKEIQNYHIRSKKNGQ